MASPLFAVAPKETGKELLTTIWQQSKMVADELTNRDMFPLQWELYQEAAFRALFNFATKAGN